MQITIIQGAIKMSNKEIKQTEKNTFSTIIKWVFIVLIVIVLEFSAIITSVFVTESRQEKNVAQWQNGFNKIAQNSEKISSLEKVSLEISENKQQIAENVGSINFLAETLNELKAEVGNKKIDVLNQQLATLSHRMETIEETKNEEALILSVALIIKENALYNRSFKSEVDILREISSTQEEIQQPVQQLASLKDTIISTDMQLIEQFSEFSENLSFDPLPIKDNNKDSENRSTVSKSIELIKDTVSNINFDKVVVLKRDTKTNEQKLLLHTLTELVKNHNFVDALNFINQNKEFDNIENVSFVSWKDKLIQKVEFDKAISKIITTELKAIRQNITTSATSEHKD